MIFVLGLIVGLEIGYKKIAEPLDSFRIMFIVSMAEQEASLQYMNANYKEAKESLIKLINLLDDMKSKGLIEEKYFNVHSFYIDKGMAFARLALLEEKEGNQLETSKNMEEASQMFKMANWTDYSEARIRFVLDKLDKKHENKETSQKQQ